MTNFLIIATGFNCAEYVKPCIDSVKNQTPGNWKMQAVFIDDGSTDYTGRNISNNISGHAYSRLPIYYYEHFSLNEGAAYRRHQAIKKYSWYGREVVILLGLDDQLLPNALNTIAAQYEAGKWMTYGNWVNQHGFGLPPDFELEFSYATHLTRDYRKATYRSTAPNTFCVELFNRIPESDFMLNGRWLDTTTESEVMFSCLEMCGRDRIGVIKEPIYLYNQNLPNGTQRRLGQGYKNEVYAEIIKRPKKAQVFEL